MRMVSRFVPMIRTTARFRARRGVPAAEAALARAGVVAGEEVGGSGHPGEAPAAAEFDPHVRASLNVADA
jgi:hypothetical protein